MGLIIPCIMCTKMWVHIIHGGLLYMTKYNISFQSFWFSYFLNFLPSFSLTFFPLFLLLLWLFCIDKIILVLTFLVFLPVTAYVVSKVVENLLWTNTSHCGEGAILSPRKHLTMCKDIFVVLVRGGIAPKHPAMHRALPHTKQEPSSQCQQSVAVHKPCCRYNFRWLHIVLLFESYLFI